MFRGLVFAIGLTAMTLAAAQPLALHPDNPHYFLFRGKPTVLITSGEHYGAVINQDFNYIRYLDTLAKHGFNLTRTFVGSYVEIPGSFNITKNTLAPKPSRFLAAWPRSSEPGAADGLNKFDLSRWNDALFARLTDFVREAGKRGIVVEVNLFTPMYEDSLWEVNPMNARNNINGIGKVQRTEVFSLADERLTGVQEALVRKVVETLRDFDNVYYEVCNEPYFAGVTQQWHMRIARTIRDAEASVPARHLISHNYSNGSKKIDDPDPAISIFNFHYSFPAESVALNYGLNRVIGNNETGFDGTAGTIYRVQAWDLLLAGGGLFNHLDYSFTAGHEDGSFGPLPPKQPGAGSPELRRQFQILRDFLNGFDFVHMSPYADLAKVVGTEPVSLRVLAAPGRAYAVYIYHAVLQEAGEERGKYKIDPASHTVALTMDLPPGSYSAEWIDTKTGAGAGKAEFRHEGGPRMLQSPAHSEDIALRIVAR